MRLWAIDALRNVPKLLPGAVGAEQYQPGRTKRCV